MNDPLRALGSARVPDAARRRIVRGALERLEPRGPALGHWMLAGAAMAAVFATVYLWPTPKSETASAAAAPPPAQARVLALGAHRVHLAPDARVRPLPAPDGNVELQLEQGTARFTVHPLAQGHHFRVHTPHLQVEVVGTDFTVALEGECTRVDVTEGRVRVHAGSGEESSLTPGQWRQHCAPVGEALVREALTLVLEGKATERGAQLLRRYLEEQPDGTFAEEALFHLWLVESARREDVGQEVSQRFLLRFPDSARAVRIRAWQETHR